MSSGKGASAPFFSSSTHRRAPRGGLDLRARLRAAAVHLALSAVVGAIVLAVVYVGWYPDPLHRLMGVGSILAIVLAVDVVLGPLFTLIVFDRSKRYLKADLAVIALVQVAALAYGVWTVQQGRPAWVVFVKDRFEVVAPADVRPADRRDARDNPQAAAHPWSPRWVAGTMPESPEARTQLLFEALSTGRDVQHYPRLYADYGLLGPAAGQRALPLSRLKALNPGREQAIAALVSRLGGSEQAIGYLPLRGSARDGAVLVTVADGRVRAVTDWAPW